MRKLKGALRELDEGIRPPPRKLTGLATMCSMGMQMQGAEHYPIYQRRVMKKLIVGRRLDPSTIFEHQPAHAGTDQGRAGADQGHAGPDQDHPVADPTR